MDALTRTRIDAAVAAERLRLADLADGLDEHRWATPSLCAGWTVAHVVAHLTVTTRLTLPSLARAALRARGDFDRMEVDLAQDRVTRHTPADLVDLLRRSAASNRRFPGSAPMDPLMDLVIHGQDVARPLGLVHTSPPEVVAASLEHVAASRFLGGPRRTAGLRLEATGSGWTRGSGPVVRGPDLDLLLAVSGRPAGLDALEGDGVVLLRDRLGG
ncbi:maleylpyruvate isomerase family mycothiol-dependent enzyme [Kineococcus sp. SYSU DK002]|uniref:maleylpyruvate isomerase family mycothiol-dependent enzyme n=1 Tax=Kineococcus sp. SYSU DK002 TaxID=3383123 RepID=UPI003D7CAAF3